jgi:hypothetical protein
MWRTSRLFPYLSVGDNLHRAERAGGDGRRWTLDRIFEYCPMLRERWRGGLGWLSLSCALAPCAFPVQPQSGATCAAACETQSQGDSKR